MNDYERFGIDPDRPGADDAFHTARFLHERGVPLETLRAMTLQELNATAWQRLYGPSGSPVDIGELAEKAELPEDRVRRILRALGFPETATPVRLLDEDAVTLRLFADAASILGDDTAMHLARVLGASVGRIAEAIASAARVNYETPLLETGTRYDFLTIAELIGRDFFPTIGVAMERTFRNHILLVSTQGWGVDAELSATTLPVAVGFADMIGFTERAGSTSTKELARLIDAFEDRVTDAIVSLGGRVVKFIGDEVMFTFEDVTAACRCARSLLDLAADQAIGDVRIGLTYGLVVTRYGDIYGPVVNLAARLVDVAPSGGILVTPELAHRAGHAFVFEEREPVTVKGVDHPIENLLLGRLET